MKHTIKAGNTIREKFMLCLLILVFFVFGCKKFVEVDAPSTSVTELNVYSNDATAAAVLTGLYIKMSSSSLRNGGITSLPLLTGLSGDELTLYSGAGNDTYLAFYTNTLTSTNFGYPNPWTDIYNYIFTCNSAIEGLSNSTSLTPALKNQLLGEAEFMRAFCYYYLVNLFGDVPLVMTTDFTINAALPRTPKTDVLTQVIADLQEAKGLLTDNYLDNAATPTTERVRPNKWAATALLARVYLLNQSYEEAESAAAEVINSNRYQLTSLADVFLMNSAEAIWQLQPVNNNFNTEDARLFVIPASGPSGDWPVYLSPEQLSVFETGDERKTAWVGRYTDTTVIPNLDYYYPYKYKVSDISSSVTEYAMVLRLSEVYLVRAEARAQQAKLSEAADDLNEIRHRAGLGDTSAASQPDLLNAILHERQVELFCEWGHRWFDLKRLNKVDEVMTTVTAQKGGDWNSNWALYPIPATDITKDPKIVQNPGY